MRNLLKAGGWFLDDICRLIRLCYSHWHGKERDNFPGEETKETIMYQGRSVPWWWRSNNYHVTYHLFHSSFHCELDHHTHLFIVYSDHLWITKYVRRELRLESESPVKRFVSPTTHNSPNVITRKGPSSPQVKFHLRCTNKSKYRDSDLTA